MIIPITETSEANGEKEAFPYDGVSWLCGLAPPPSVIDPLDQLVNSIHRLR